MAKPATYTQVRPTTPKTHLLDLFLHQLPGAHTDSHRDTGIPNTSLSAHTKAFKLPWLGALCSISNTTHNLPHVHVASM